MVLGAFSEEVPGSRKLQGCRIVLNDAWKNGIAGSIRVGTGELGAVEGLIVLTCDMPFVTAPHRILQAIRVHRHS